MEGATRIVSDWIANAEYGDFPQETIDTVKGLLLKTATGMVIGAREPIGKVITNYLARTAGPPVAGVTGGGFLTTVEDAAYAHGVFAHASELEDDEFPQTGDFEATAKVISRQPRHRCAVSRAVQVSGPGVEKKFMSSAQDLVVGPDGRHRCWWCGDDPQYVGYHDLEWGQPVAEDGRLFEKICLEGF